ncbi:hypothetical protein BC628DRAFT_54861 [Trametes gibbosa]|nr:hypothetical protein BC628DRAFT_54861 [Trametes gibbosa]
MAPPSHLVPPPMVEPVEISASLFPQAPSLNSTYGAVLIGTFIGLLLYGVTLHQAYRYARRHLMDSLYIKSYVGFLVILGTWHAVVSMHMNYWYLVINYFQPLALFKPVWSIDILPISTAIAIISCQCFFARRVYLVGKRFRPLVAIAAILFLGEFGFALAGSVQAFILPSLAAYRNVAWVNSAGFGIAVGVDTMMTTVLVYVLRGSRTGFKRTNSVIDLLIAYTVTTGFLTDVFSTFSLVMALVGPENLIYAASNIVTTQLYIICVLGTLNSRRPLQPSQPSENLSAPNLFHLSDLTHSGCTSGGTETASSRLEDKHVGFTLTEGLRQPVAVPNDGHF